MRRKVKPLFIIMCLVSMFFILSSINSMAVEIPDERIFPRVVDNAGLLDDSEENTLLNTVDEISQRQKCDVVIVTVNSLEGKKAKEYADDFFDYNGYGIGENKDGILFLIAMDDRKWAVSTHGFGIKAFTDAGQDRIIDNVKPYLSDGQYNKAFILFAQYCDEYLTQAYTGKPYDKNNMPKENIPPCFILIAIGVGAVISLIIMVIWKKSSLTTVHMEKAADRYVVNGSMRLRESREMFLYRNVTRTRKPQDDGGSSINISSSGESHGGSSGSF